jgi:hypothetical protein
MFPWEEECNTIVYVKNKSPHRILGDKTLKEEFSGVKPKIGHFNIFGYPFYIYFPMQKRMKLEPSGHKGVFLEYNETSKDYNIFIPKQ